MRKSKSRVRDAGLSEPVDPLIKIEALTRRLSEAEALIEAIVAGEVEGLVLKAREGERIFSLQGADRTYRLFVEVMSEGAVTVSSDGTILYCNKRFAEMVKTGMDEVIGAAFQEYLPEKERKAFAKLLFRGQAGQRRKDFNLTASRVAHLPVRLSIAPLLGQEHQKSISMVVTDMTEHKKAEERLVALSRRLLEVQENERRHLARELHDEVGQLLTGLKIMLETSNMLQEGGNRALGEARQQVAELIERIHDMSLDLRPPVLDDLGLVPAILWHLQRYESQTQIEVHFSHSGIAGKRFEAQIETTAYRIIQEALTNTARHSGAKAAKVKAEADSEGISLEIEDNGKGFDVQKALISAVSSGLTGMRERAGLLGGELNINSGSGKGTRIQAKLPSKFPGKP